ncbi:nuclear transport factor 2 family protein [Gordonia sp. (in: high G+C Gram-positive bacteria)]|uniref:nuclear transport factor 2 family protein n=1 Tax=Gordonia sp. (in: high G+C Gram-positive bacteria) TaxID=84139 RepID=UPI0016B49A12|nr:nuclear transport factor 2 family protein [Gordonia sp. (in: high G+C Gram-positive bacteria)]NLG48106.1 nuclear transport factor 2 family protein [Gordonia sp. (in: high G+C Gram-positive bacteria)]
MSTELTGTVAAFVETVNQHDDAFLDFFTDDGFVDDWGRIFSGRDAIKRWSDKEFIGAKGTMTVTQVDTDGEDIVVVADWRSSWANGLSRFTFRPTGDKIAAMIIREG